MQLFSAVGPYALDASIENLERLTELSRIEYLALPKTFADEKIGQRYRESLDTTDWREAQAKQKELITQASQGKLAAGSQQFGRLAFGHAADLYAAERVSHLAARSVQTEIERLKPLRTYFGSTSLSRVSADSIREYVAHRKSANLSNRTINMEVDCLSRMLKRAKRWHLLADEITPLPERHNIGRALTPPSRKQIC